MFFTLVAKQLDERMPTLWTSRAVKGGALLDVMVNGFALLGLISWAKGLGVVPTQVAQAAVGVQIGFCIGSVVLVLRQKTDRQLLLAKKAAEREVGRLQIVVSGQGVSHRAEIERLTEAKREVETRLTREKNEILAEAASKEKRQRLWSAAVVKREAPLVVVVEPKGATSLQDLEDRFNEIIALCQKNDHTFDARTLLNDRLIEYFESVVPSFSDERLKEQGTNMIWVIYTGNADFAFWHHTHGLAENYAKMMVDHINLIRKALTKANIRNLEKLEGIGWAGRMGIPQDDRHSSKWKKEGV